MSIWMMIWEVIIIGFDVGDGFLGWLCGSDII